MESPPNNDNNKTQLYAQKCQHKREQQWRDSKPYNCNNSIKTYKRIQAYSSCAIPVETKAYTGSRLQ